MISRLLRIMLFWIALLPGAAIAAVDAQSDSQIPWNHALTITRTSSDDDLRNVFRSLLQQNGLSVMFGPGVNQTVSFHLEDEPIDTAFEQLIDQHHLTYNYLP